MLAHPHGALALGPNTDAKRTSGKDALRIDSLIFLNMANQQQSTNGHRTHNMTAPVMDRGYLNIYRRFNDMWRMRLTTNIEADPNLPGQKVHAYLKYAYLVGNFSPAMQLITGLMHTPWIHYEQNLDRHRFITKCFINSNEFDHSSDAGLGLRGKLMAGRIGYWVTETVGGGYMDLKRTRGLDFDSRIGFYPSGTSPANGWTFDLQYRNGFLGKDVAGTLNPSRYQLVQAMTTYTHDDIFRIAAGYVTQHQSHYQDQANNNLNTLAFYAWAWDRFTPRFGAYCRYEFRQQHDDIAPATEKKFHSVLALDYRTSAHLTLALAWDHTAYDNMGLAANATQQNNRYGLYSRIRF